MRTGAGLRNALLFTVLIFALHCVMVKHASVPAKRQGGGAAPGTPPPRPPRIPTSTPMDDVRRRQRGGDRGDRGYLAAWPPTPGDMADEIPIGEFKPSAQKPYTREDEERAALHRLVFSQSEPEDLPREARPAMMPDYSEVHMAAEGSITSDLPMFYINPRARGEGNSDWVSGISSWGAGYQPVTA